MFIQAGMSNQVERCSDLKTNILVTEEEVFKMAKGSGARRCPKCNGNIFWERDDSIRSGGQSYGWNGWCLQCGYMVYLKASEMITGEVKAGKAIEEPSVI
jgi:predicted nucleic-acid-binding Zn-ribbon protein